MSPSSSAAVVLGIGLVVGLVVLIAKRSGATAEPDTSFLRAEPSRPHRPLYSSRALAKPQQLAADLIIERAQAAGINPQFMLALAVTESSLNPVAVGDDNTSFGLFQIQLGTARDHNAGIDMASLLFADVNVDLAMQEMLRLHRVYPGHAYADYAEAWTLGGRGRFVKGRRNPTKITRMHQAIDDLDLDLLLLEVWP